MKKALGNIFNKTPSTTSGIGIGSNADGQRKNLNTHQSSDSRNHQEKKLPVIIDIATPSLSQPSSTQHERVILVEASSTTFGNECLRLVNIIFQTSQTFQSIMGTCGNVTQYLRKELFKKYPGEYFHIIIGQNKKFGFAINDGDYFAELEQKQYRVLIFTTKLDRKVNLATHETNSQMMLEWKSVVVKQSRK
jgi:hypothetical protein